MIEIIPSVLTNNLVEARDLINRVEGLVERIQIDVVDGIFAANKTVDPSLFIDIETSAKLDFHLMVKEPVNWIEKCVAVGADRIVGQIEMMHSPSEFVEKVHAQGVGCGLALDLYTDVSRIDESILVELEVVLVMSVPAGRGGQGFDKRALGKIKKLKELKDKFNAAFAICDDGGLTLENVDEAHLFGVDEVVIGRRLFEGDIAENISNYKKASHGLELN